MSNGHTSSIPIPTTSPPMRRRQDSLSDNKTPVADPLSRSITNNPLANVAVNARSNRGRRLSMNTFGLSGSPTQPSPFLGGHLFSHPPANPATDEDARRGSTVVPGARRRSIGGEANDLSPGSSLAERRRASMSAGQFPTHNPAGVSPADLHKTFSYKDASNLPWRHNHPGEGFNWSEALRTRVGRPLSFSSAPINSAEQHDRAQRAASIASIEQPAHPASKNIHHKRVTPDSFQEKILRGDYIID